MNKMLILALAATTPAICARAAEISPTKFETVPPGEAGQIQEIASLTTQLLKMRYGDSMARRGVHPKDHGCVKAAFTVNSDLPEKYRVGVFAQPAKKYDAWIRFSNATGTVTSDLVKDAQGKDGPVSRGMAIKLMGVEGDTLLGEPGAKTQDFLLINLPGFAFSNVSVYLDVTRIQLANNDVIKSFFAPPFTPDKLKTIAVVKRIAQTQLGNPLDSRYFSAAPFLFGKDAVAKFGVTPRNPENTPVPENPGRNYLREAMKKSLDFPSGKPAVFDFQVQLRTNDSLPVEDATAEWPEAVVPFQNVATITIDRQDFNNPLQVTECEHLVFTPWHGLAAHQPLGGINRLRLQVYIASSQHRAQPREPSEFPKELMGFPK
jgi:hypothetical protein